MFCSLQCLWPCTLADQRDGPTDRGLAPMHRSGVQNSNSQWEHTLPLKSCSRVKQSINKTCWISTDLQSAWIDDAFKKLSRSMGEDSPPPSLCNPFAFSPFHSISIGVPSQPNQTNVFKSYQGNDRRGCPWMKSYQFATMHKWMKS